MSTIPLRYLAEINPATPEFDSLPDDEQLNFAPLETVWADTRADFGRRVSKSLVKSGYTRYRADDILCPKVTPTFQAGRSMIARELGAGTTELHVLRPRVGVDGRYLAYAVRSKPFLDEGVTAFQGVAGLQRVPPDFVESFRVFNYEYAEQRRIADFLDDRVSRIDNIISARRRQIDSASALRWATFSALLDQITAPSVPLRRVIEFIADGPFGSAFSSADYVDDGPAVIRLGNIGFAEFRASELRRVPDAIYDAHPRCHIRPGDLLIASLGDASNHAGRACVAPNSLGKAMVKGKCFVARPKSGLSTAGFLALLLSSPLGSEVLARQGRGATRNMLNFELLLSSSFPMPNEEAQGLLVREFDVESSRLQIVREHLMTSVSLLTEYKQSLITAAVTGELDVTTASKKVPA